MFDVTVSTFIVSLDVIHPTLDIATLQDYVKNNFKKDFIFLNATDYVDSSGGRSSRTDSRSEKRPKNDYSSGISKGLKNKMDSEISKLIEAKKRHLAQQEKQKAKESKRGTSKAAPETPILYDGQVEAVFCILNYPYTSLQLKRLYEGGVDLGAFITLKTTGNLDAIADQVKNKTFEKSARTIAKRQLIEGSDMDSTLNPGVYPPLRWGQLKENAAPTTVFSTVDIGDTVEEMWLSLEKEIGTIIRCRNKFKETFKERVFHSLPYANDRIDYTELNKFLQHYPGDVYPAIMYMLLEGGGIKEPVEVPPPTLKDQYENLFADGLKMLDRSVSFNKNAKLARDESEIDFELTIPSLPSIYDVLYKLIKWEPNLELCYASRAVMNFYTDPLQFYCAAGHQFDVMVAQANKKFNLGLPTSFYDWQKWGQYKEYENCMDELEKAVESANYVSTYLEEAPGILWVLTMTPISKLVGFTVKTHYMPQMIDGVDQWYKYIFDKPVEIEKKSSRSKETTADIIRRGKMKSLLTPIETRLDAEQHDIYRLPIEYSDTVSLITPYLFIDGFRADVDRTIYARYPSFNVTAHYKNGLKVTTNGSDTNIMSKHCRIQMDEEHDITIFQENSSIYYAYGKLMLKISNDRDYLITEDGQLIFVDLDNVKTIIGKNGLIGRLINNKWEWTSNKGQTYTKTENKLECNKEKVLPTTDYYTKITKYVRNDLFNLEEYDDGTIILRIDEEFVIRFSDNTTNFQIPNFPNITVKKQTFSFQIGDISFNLGDKNINIASQEFTATKSGETLSLTSDQTISNFTPKAVQFRSGDEILFTAPNCVERFGTIQPPDMKPNKKLEVVTSLWGNIIPLKDIQTEARLLDLHKLFCPRFFAIRSGLIATEFIHDSQLPVSTKTMKEASDTLRETTVDIVSFHKDGEKPDLYIKQSMPDKLSRINILKTLQVPKHPPKPKSARSRKNEKVESQEEVFEEANRLRAVFEQRKQRTHEIAQSLAEDNEKDYQLEVHPPPIPPEPIPPPAVFTPPPSVLIAQAQKYAKKANKGEILSYWDSPEAAFAMPESPNTIVQKPVSPRNAMHDLVTPDDDSKGNPPEDVDEDLKMKTRESISLARAILTPSSLSPPLTAARMYRTEVMKPALYYPDRKYVADFKTLHIGDTALQYVKVQNTSKQQMNYSFSQPSNPNITILTPPGVIASGLTLNIKVKFVAKKAEKLRASFNIQTNHGTIPVACNAQVVP